MLRSAPRVICDKAALVVRDIRFVFVTGYADHGLPAYRDRPALRLKRTLQERLGTWQSSSKNGQVAARAIQHHPATLVSGAGVPPHCLEAVYFRLQAAQVVSDCFWRHVHSNYLLVAEYAYGPPPGSAHFLSSLIESSRS